MLSIVFYLAVINIFQYIGMVFWVSLLATFGVSILIGMVRYKLRYRGIKVALIENTRWLSDEIPMKSKGDDVDGF